MLGGLFGFGEGGTTNIVGGIPVSSLSHTHCLAGVVGTGMGDGVKPGVGLGLGAGVGKGPGAGSYGVGGLVDP